MYADNYKPDYIVGITRGGNIPATIISNMLDIPCEAIKVSFRNDDRVEKNHWLSTLDKKILIVDDINDTGATFNWIWKDWDLSKKDHKVKFAVLTDNMGSTFEEVNYSVHEVNKTEEDVWLVYPWENVGDYDV